MMLAFKVLDTTLSEFLVFFSEREREREREVHGGGGLRKGYFLVLFLLVVLFYIHISIIWIYVMSCAQSCKRPAGHLARKNVNITCKICSYLPYIYATLTSANLYCCHRP